MYMESVDSWRLETNPRSRTPTRRLLGAHLKKPPIRSSPSPYKTQSAPDRSLKQPPPSLRRIEFFLEVAAERQGALQLGAGLSQAPLLLPVLPTSLKEGPTVSWNFNEGSMVYS